MKRLILISLLLIAALSFAQTKVIDQNGLLKVTYTIPAQTTDSTTTLTSSTFSLPSDYSFTNWSVNPPTSAMKVTSTYGKPQTLIVLKGFFNGGSDSYNMDTIRVSAANQTVGDTAGVFGRSTNNIRASYYQITVTNTANAISGGFVELYFTKAQYIPTFNYNK
ncbi:MAG: hypothetical protein ACYDBV_13515 [Nitrospiria bacterium]